MKIISSRYNLIKQSNAYFATLDLSSMFMSNFTLSLLFKVTEIFGLDKFLKSRSNIMIVSDFFSIHCFFLKSELLKDKAAFFLADYIFSSATSTFLAILSSNFFRDIFSTLTLFFFLSRALFIAVSTFFAAPFAFFAIVIAFLVFLFSA